MEFKRLEDLGWEYGLTPEDERLITAVVFLLKELNRNHFDDEDNPLFCKCGKADCEIRNVLKSAENLRK